MARHKLYPESVRPGMPKMPRLPPGWRAVPFGELLSPVYRPAELDDEVTYQLVTAKRSRGGIVPREALTGAEIKTKGQFYVQGGDFLISRRQIIHGACGFVPEALSGAVVSGEYDVLAVGPALLPEYLEAFTHTTYFQQSCFQSSVGVDIEKMVFDLDHWFTYPMPLPPLEEQARIAGVLGRIKAALRANERALEQARRVKKALLSRLLSEGIGHTRFKETEIGRVPEGWEVMPIEAFAKIQCGATPLRDDDGYFDNGTIPWVKTLDLNEGEIAATDELITDRAIRETSCRILPVGTVLCAMYGGFQQIGRTGILAVPAATNQAIAAITIHDGRITPKFLLYWLIAQRPRWKTIAASSRKDPNITRQDVCSFQVAVPPLAEQHRIVAMVQSTFRVSDQVEVAAARLHSAQAATRAILLETP